MRYVIIIESEEKIDLAKVDKAINNFLDEDYELILFEKKEEKK